MNDLTPWLEVIAHAARPHQRQHIHNVLTAPTRKTMLMGMRQDVGKTWDQSALAVMLANGIEYCGREIPAHDVYCISADQQRGIDIIRRVSDHLDAASIAYDPRDPKLGSTTRLAMRNGAQIRALTSDPSNLQGLTGSVIVDEFSLSPDPEAVMAQALSVTRAAPYFRVSVTTNASGEDTYLARFFNDPDMAERRAEWACQTVTVNDLYPDGLPDDLESVRRALDLDSWRRFYLCEFVGSDLPILRPDLRDRCADDQTPEHHRPIDGRRWISVDVGMGRHATSVVEFSQVGQHIQIDRVHLFWIKDTGEQVRRIAGIARHIGATSVYIDAGSVGRGVADGLRDESLPVVYCATSDATRSAGADTLRSLAERGLISWGHCRGEVAELRRDLGAVMRIEDAEGKTKAVKLPERKTDSGQVTHCDALDAVLQALAQTQTRPASTLHIGRRIPAASL